MWSLLHVFGVMATSSSGLSSADRPSAVSVAGDSQFLKEEDRRLTGLRKTREDRHGSLKKSVHPLTLHLDVVCVTFGLGDDELHVLGAVLDDLRRLAEGHALQADVVQGDEATTWGQKVTGMLLVQKKLLLAPPQIKDGRPRESSPGRMRPSLSAGPLGTIEATKMPKSKWPTASSPTITIPAWTQNQKRLDVDSALPFTPRSCRSVSLFLSLPRPSFGSFRKETHRTSLSDGVLSLVGVSAGATGRLLT